MKIIIYTIIALFSCLNLFAQDITDKPQDLRHQNFLLEPLNLRKGFFRSTIGYAFIPWHSKFNEEGKRTYLMSLPGTASRSGESSYMSQYQLSFTYGLTHNIQIGIDLPYLDNENYWIENWEFVPRNTIINETTNKYTKGFGDLSTSISYQFIEKPSFYSSINMDFGFPTGSTKTKTTPGDVTVIREQASSGKYDLGLGINLKKIIYPFSFKLYSSYSHSWNKADSFAKGSGCFYAGGYWGLLLNDWFSINNYWDYNRSGKYNTVNSGIAIIQQVKRFRFTQNVIMPITAPPIYPADVNFRFMISYTL